MACPSKTASACLRSFEIWLERYADLGTGPVQQHPCIGLLNPQNVTHLLRGAALDVTKNQHQPLVLRQRLDGVLELLACLAGQEPMLRRGSQVLRRMGPMASIWRSSSPTPSATAAVRERKRIESSTGSEIRVQHYAVTGLARIESGEGLVDRTHREVLGLRRDIVP